VRSHAPLLDAVRIRRGPSHPNLFASAFVVHCRSTMTAINLRFSICATAILLASCSPDSTQRASQPTSAAQSQQSQQQLDTQNSGPAPAWLNELNRLRETGGLKPVAENGALSRDCDAHAKYLVEQGPSSAPQFMDYERDLGLRAHHEDPASPHFSAAGAECAAGGKDAPGVSQSNDVSWGRNPIDDLDGLFYDAPFHRLSLLAPWATVAGYGTYGDYPRRAGTMALRGEGGIGSPLIRFPTDGSTVPVGQVNSFEMPDPLASCAGYSLPVGLPITVQLGSGYRGRMLSYSVRGPAGAVETCGFDWTSYQNPDAATQELARKLLRAFGAIILIPRQPLADGRYAVAVSTGRQNFEWSFTVSNRTASAATQ
jgi:hypothetical protein